MKLPKEVKIGPISYKIIGVDKKRSSLTFGSVKFFKQSIEIRNSMPADTTAETLMHEILHCIIDQSGLGLELKDEENLVRVLSPKILSMLKENKEVVEFLCRNSK